MKKKKIPKPARNSKPHPLANGWRVFNQAIEVEPSVGWRGDSDGNFMVDGV